jgi:hypothetical protein
LAFAGAGFLAGAMDGSVAGALAGVLAFVFAVSVAFGAALAGADLALAEACRLVFAGAGGVAPFLFPAGGAVLVSTGVSGTSPDRTGSILVVSSMVVPLCRP